MRICRASCGGNGREEGSERRELRYEDARSGVMGCDAVYPVLVDGRDSDESDSCAGSGVAAAAAAANVRAIGCKRSHQFCVSARSGTKHSHCMNNPRRNPVSCFATWLATRVDLACLSTVPDKVIGLLFMVGSRFRRFDRVLCGGGSSRWQRMSRAAQGTRMSSDLMHALTIGRLYFPETLGRLALLALAQLFPRARGDRCDREGDDECIGRVMLVAPCLVSLISMSEPAQSTAVAAASPEKDETDSREPQVDFRSGEDERDPEEVRDNKPSSKH